MATVTELALVRHVKSIRSMVLWSSIVTNLLILALVAIVAIVASHVVHAVSGELTQAFISLRKATSAITSFFQSNPNAASHIENQLVTNNNDDDKPHRPPPPLTRRGGVKSGGGV